MPKVTHGYELSAARRRLAVASVAILPLMLLHDVPGMPEAAWDTGFIIWALMFLFLSCRIGTEKSLKDRAKSKVPTPVQETQSSGNGASASLSSGVGAARHGASAAMGGKQVSEFQ